MQFFCVGFGAAICDQLIGQALSWRYMGEHSPRSLDSRPTFGGFARFRGMSHGPRVQLMLEIPVFRAVDGCHSATKDSRGSFLPLLTTR
jgi:hypothetical protein